MHGGIYRCTGIYFFKSAPFPDNLLVLTSKTFYNEPVWCNSYFVKKYYNK